MLRLTPKAYEAHQKRVGRPVAVQAVAKARKDTLPQLLADKAVAGGLPAPLVEYPFARHIGRKFQADCCWLEAKLIVEVQGAVHRIKDKFKRDRERSQVVASLGYRLMFVSPAEVKDGSAVEIVRRALR